MDLRFQRFVFLILKGSELQNLVDKYVDTYLHLLNNMTAYDRMQSLANDSRKLLTLSETLGTMLVNGSMGYVETDSENKTTIYFRGVGFSSQFKKLHTFFDDKTTGIEKDPKWLRYVDLETDSAYLHGCYDGPSCFPETQDRLDVLASPMVRLLKKLGVIYDLKTTINDTISRLVSNRFNHTTPTIAETVGLVDTHRLSMTRWRRHLGET